MLYRLSKFFLHWKIKFFADMLSLPWGVNNMLEGTCDSYPIYVPRITEETFEFVLSNMFGRYVFTLAPTYVCDDPFVGMSQSQQSQTSLPDWIAPSSGLSQTFIYMQLTISMCMSSSAMFILPLLSL